MPLWSTDWPFGQSTSERSMQIGRSSFPSDLLVKIIAQPTFLITFSVTLTVFCRLEDGMGREETHSPEDSKPSKVFA